MQRKYKEKWASAAGISDSNSDDMGGKWAFRRQYRSFLQQILGPSYFPQKMKYLGTSRCGLLVIFQNMLSSLGLTSGKDWLLGIECDSDVLRFLQTAFFALRVMRADNTCFSSALSVQQFGSTS
ncbi:hypothetical protein Bca4012_073519 [Brassica carinata]